MIEGWIRNFYKINDSLPYITKKIIKEGLKIDHIAHRCFNYNHVIKYYERHNFSIQPDRYLFQHLDAEALWLKSPRPAGCKDRYRVYISQYIGSQPIHQIHSKKDYEDVYNYSPYLAWISLFNNHINHIALKVDNIEATYNKIRGLNELEVSSNIVSSEDGQIQQFSLKPTMIQYSFPSGDTGYVQGGFVEFYQRDNGREGFDIGNSQKIYESTK